MLMINNDSNTHICVFMYFWGFELRDFKSERNGGQCISEGNSEGGGKAIKKWQGQWEITEISARFFSLTCAR